MDNGATFQFDQLRTLLQKVNLIAQSHESIVKTFWNDKRTTFGQESPNEDENHVTSACTCVLSFLDAPAGRLPKFVENAKAQFVQWLLSVEWGSEDLGDPNPYTTPIALSTVELLDEAALTNPKCQK